MSDVCREAWRSFSPIAEDRVKNLNCSSHLLRERQTKAAFAIRRFEEAAPRTDKREIYHRRTIGFYTSNFILVNGRV